MPIKVCAIVRIRSGPSRETTERVNAYPQANASSEMEISDVTGRAERGCSVSGFRSSRVSLQCSIHDTHTLTIRWFFIGARPSATNFSTKAMVRPWPAYGLSWDDGGLPMAKVIAYSWLLLWKATPRAIIVWQMVTVDNLGYRPRAETAVRSDHQLLSDLCITII